MTTSTVSRLGRAPEEGIKAPCKSSTTGPITLVGTGQSLNGVIMNTGDRALVKDQVLDSGNGIFIVGPNDWERASDMNADNDVVNGQLISDANTGQLFKINVTSPWTPDATPITFEEYAIVMPPSIVLTSSAAVDLVDTDTPLVVGSSTPNLSQHLEFDFQSVQSKSDATNVSPLFLNPLGGDVNVGAGNLIVGGNVDGRDVAADGTAQDTHIADATIHFTQASISITESQISDLQAYLLAEVNDLSAAVTWANIPDANVPASAVTQHQAALSITESQISDLGNYTLVGHTHVEADITDLGNYSLVGHTHLEADITDLQNYSLVGHIHAPVTATTAELVAIANAINTTADKVAGYEVFNTTTGAPVWAVGAADGDVWNDATGATAHTPV